MDLPGATEITAGATFVTSIFTALPILGGLLALVSMFRIGPLAIKALTKAFPR